MITVLNVEEYKNGVFRVTLSNRKKLLLTADLIAQYGVLEGAEIEPSVIKEAQTVCAMIKASTALSYRNYSVLEMTAKLTALFDEDIAAETVEKLVSAGYLNDENYAEQLAYMYCDVKKYGYYRACNEMKRKGLDKYLIEDVLEKYKLNAVDTIIEILEARNVCLDSREEIQKTKNFLARRGFSFSDINDAINNYN